MKGSDSRDTLVGAEIIYNAIHTNVFDFIKIIFGLHTNLDSDPLQKPYFSIINDWGNSPTANNFLLNDNRTSMRIHAIIRLISNKYYAVHALAMLIASFFGQWAFYKTFKRYFIGKEKLLAIIIFLTPTVLFWSSGILKEPLALCILGFFLLSFFNVFVHKLNTLKNISGLLFSTLAFVFLKPYILILLVLPLLVFVLVHRFQIKKIILFYVATLILLFSFSILTFKYILKKDVIKTIVARQNDFINLSNGGIFFINKKIYARLDCKDKKQFMFVDSATKMCRILPHTKLMYWNLGHQNDTIFEPNFCDTTLYEFVSYNEPAGSAINMPRLQYNVQSFCKIIPKSFYNVLVKPFFFDARSKPELIASVENLFFLLFFIFCFYYHTKHKLNINVLCFCFAVIILSYLLIGLTTTITGAIVRYKMPFIPILLMIPLLVVDKENKWVKLFSTK